MSENLKFYKGLEANLPTSGIEIGALYHCTDTGNTYRGVTSTEMQLFSTTNSESDWNANENEIGYVKNRTHWIEDGPGEPIFENISIEANSSWDIIYPDFYDFFTLVQKNIYVLVNNINEKVENRWFEDWTEENQTSPHGGCSTKSLSIQEYAGGGNIINRTEQDIVVSIYHAISVYHKLDKNFLPENLNIPVKSGENQTSLIGNDLENNITIGKNNTAFGSNNITGAKGFYIRNIDIVNKKIDLWVPDEYDPGPIYPTFEIGYHNYDPDLDLSEYSIGDYIDITAYGHYHWILCSNIAEIGNNYIIYDSGIDDSANKLTTGEVPYYFSVPSKPLAGVINFSNTAFAEGDSNIAAGQFSHVEGYGNISTGRYSHAEGFGTLSGYNSHAEGEGTKAIGLSSHAEGFNTTASGFHAHAEGSKTTASGNYAHAEGFNTTASGERAHSEGALNEATSLDAHAEGFKTKAINGQATHAEGIESVASGKGSHAEGRGAVASSEYQHVQGKYNIKDASNIYAHIVGNGTSDTERSNAHTLDWNGNAWFAGDIESGSGKLATETYVNEQIAGIQPPETDLTNYATKSYVNSHYIKAGQKSGSILGNKATAEGSNTTASGERSHAEGYDTTASGFDTHAEGFKTTAGNGQAAHSEGMQSAATGKASHAEGYGTIASGESQHVQGKYNIEDSSKAHIVGNGNSSVRSNAHTLDWNGNAWFAGDISLAAPANEALPTGVTLSSRLPRLYFGTTDPTTLSFGKNGDIYIMIE